MDKLQSIVVGIDFTSCSAVALRQAMRIAAWHGARVQVVHVIDTLVAQEMEETLTSLQANIRTRLVDDARAGFKAFAADVPGAADLPVDVRVDNRINGILHHLDEHKADLLVLGAFGTNPDVGVGTVATACVRRAASPVLLVRDNQHGPFRTIVAAVDFSETSFQSLENAARVALQDRAALHVVHAFQGPWHVIHYRAPTAEADPGFRKQFTDAMQHRLEAFVARLGQAARDLQPTIKLVEHTSSGAAIVEYAQKADADLVALGTHGRSGLRELFLGTTAERVLRKCRSSILTANPSCLREQPSKG